jgi:hypothetical protein
LLQVVAVEVKPHLVVVERVVCAAQLLQLAVAVP